MGEDEGVRDPSSHLDTIKQAVEMGGLRKFGGRYKI